MQDVSKTKEEIFLRDEIVNFWLTDVGLKETDGPNRSPLCDEINTKIGVPLGSPYCLSGLLIRGLVPLCEKHKLVNPIKPTASTQRFFKDMQTHFPLFVHGPGDNALKGDICILRDRTNFTIGHAYAPTLNERLGIQKTVEYNTNSGLSRNGDGVYQLTRTQDGTKTKEYLGAVDVVGILLAANPTFKI